MEIVEGQTAMLYHDFLDENDQPIVPKPGWPKAVLIDSDKNTIMSTLCFPDLNTPGSWNASIVVPNMGLEDKQKFAVRWRMVDNQDNKFSDRDTIVVVPAVERRASDIVVLSDDTDFSFTLPIEFNRGDVGSYRIYLSNDPLSGEIDLNSTEVHRGVGKATFTAQVPVGWQPTLRSYMLRVRTRSPKKEVFTYSMWNITPSIAHAMSLVEAYLNKARVQNVIPELDYTDSDLMIYLERGLYLFNRIQYTTSFTGINMQGTLQDAWIICSTYYALCSQIMAEGQLAFDFSGQGVSLNVDRTPQLEAAIGRMESEINERLPQLKKQMNANGITGGDGSIGSTNMRNPWARLNLGLANTPLTRINGIALGGYGRVFRRS